MDVVNLLIILGGVAGGLLLLLIFTLLCYRRRSSSAVAKKKLSRLAAELEAYSEGSLDTAQRSIKFGNMPSYRDEKRRNKRVLHKIHEVSDERDSLSNKSGLSYKSAGSAPLHIPVPPAMPSPHVPPERGILKRRDSESDRGGDPEASERLLRGESSREKGVVSSSGDGGYESEPPVYSAYRLFQHSLRKLDEYGTHQGGPALSPATNSPQRPQRQTQALFSPPPERVQKPLRVIRSGYATDTEIAYCFTPRFDSNLAFDFI